MRAREWHAVAWNAFLSLVVVYPIWFGLWWSWASALKGSQGIWYEAVPYYLLIFSGPLLVGSLIHQLGLRLVPESWSNRRRRLVAMVTSAALVPVVIVALSDVRGFFSSGEFIPWSTGALVYGLLMRLPASDASSTRSGNAR